MLLLTADKDFGELIFRQRLTHSGLLLLRLAGLASVEKASLVWLTLRNREDHLRSRLAVLTPATLRIRPFA